MSEWFQIGGRKTRTRIAAREWREVEREKQRATEIDLEPVRYPWVDEALDWLWGRDMVPDHLTPDLRALMWEGTENPKLYEAIDRLGLDRKALQWQLRKNDLPAPLGWLRLGQLLAAMQLICNRGARRVTAARAVGFSESPQLYKSMRRTLDMTPDEVEALPSPQWRAVVERWWEEWAG